MFARGKVDEEEVTEWNIVQQDDDTKVASKEKTLMKSKPMNVAAVALFNFFYLPIQLK